MLNYLIFGLIIFTIGYVGYIQSKQGIRVAGSTEMIDPFRYESGDYHNIYGGINPYSKASHISESELQSRKFKKMGNVVIFTIPAILFLFFLKSKKPENSIPENPEIKPKSKNNLTDEEERRLSLVELAIKLACPAEDVKFYYLKELEDNEFGFTDLIASENAWIRKKSEDAKILDIKPENTPAALMLEWTKEYRFKKFINSKT